MTDDIDEIVRSLRILGNTLYHAGPWKQLPDIAADALERLKADRDLQDKCAELQARQIMEQTDEIERLREEVRRLNEALKERRGATPIYGGEIEAAAGVGYQSVDIAARNKMFYRLEAEIERLRKALQRIARGEGREIAIARAALEGTVTISPSPPESLA